jgi:tetratricopeptide (TPR) repeat protein
MKPISLRALGCGCLVGLLSLISSAHSAPADDTSVSGYSLARLINQGNAYFREGRYPQARVCYERALLLNPRQPAARQNQQLTLQKLNREMPTSAWWERLIGQRSFDEWSLAGIFAFLLLGAVLLHYCWHGRLPKPLRWLAAVGALTLLVSLFALTVHWPKLHQGVALAPASLRLSPFAQAQVTGSLPAGAEAIIHRLHPGWYWVEDTAGQKGWVAATQFEPLVPELVGRFSRR